MGVILLVLRWSLVQDSINNWRKTALILTSILFPAAAIWFIGKFLQAKPFRSFQKSNARVFRETLVIQFYSSPLGSDGNFWNIFNCCINSCEQQCVIAGVFLKSVDRFNEDTENQLNATCDRSNNTTPLLEGETAEVKSSPST